MAPHGPHLLLCHWFGIAFHTFWHSLEKWALLNFARWKLKEGTAVMGKDANLFYLHIPPDPVGPLHRWFGSKMQAKYSEQRSKEGQISARAHKASSHFWEGMETYFLYIRIRMLSLSSSVHVTLATALSLTLLMTGLSFFSADYHQQRRAVSASLTRCRRHKIG